MKIEDLLRKESVWLKGTGPKSNIVISSRVRLARNLDGFPFFNWAKPKEKEKIQNTVNAAVGKSRFMKKALSLKMKDLAEIDRQFLVERHLMSPEHVVDAEYKGLVIDEQEIASIMINEEDHLRIQILQSGFNIIEAWRMSDEIDTDLGRRVAYASSPRWGYLTACPTNTGTGLRASVMLHLPALVMTNQIGKVFQAISKLGLTMRGFYGEGTEATGDFFQLSNQTTLGKTEQQIVQDFTDDILPDFIDYELAARAAYRQTMPNAGPQLMEPIMKVEVEVPQEFQGAVVGDLNSRRGIILDTEIRDTCVVVRAEVPLASMFGYATIVRGLSKGMATFSMEMSRYARVPAKLAEGIINERRERQAARK